MQTSSFTPVPVPSSLSHVPVNMMAGSCYNVPSGFSSGSTSTDSFHVTPSVAPVTDLPLRMDQPTLDPSARVAFIDIKRNLVCINTCVEAEILDELQQHLNSTVITEALNPLPVEAIVQGRMALAFFEGELYRARVLHAVTKTVEFVDYGNVEVVDTLFDIPQPALLLSPLCVKCRFPAGFDISKFEVGGVLSVELCSFDVTTNVWKCRTPRSKPVASLPPAKAVEDKVAEKQEAIPMNPKVAEKQEAIPVNLKVAEKQEAVPIYPSYPGEETVLPPLQTTSPDFLPPRSPSPDIDMKFKSDLPSQKKSSGDIINGEVLFVERDHGQITFFVTEKKETLDSLQDILNVPAVSQPLRVPHKKVAVGMLCLADYEGELYRSVVKYHNQQGTTVEFIDYGNCEVVQEVLQIPESALKYPRLSLKCRMADPQHLADLDVGSVVSNWVLIQHNAVEDVWKCIAPAPVVGKYNLEELLTMGTSCSNLTTPFPTLFTDLASVQEGDFKVADIFASSVVILSSCHAGRQQTAWKTGMQEQYRVIEDCFSHITRLHRPRLPSNTGLLQSRPREVFTCHMNVVGAVRVLLWESEYRRCVILQPPCSGNMNMLYITFLDEDHPKVIKLPEATASMLLPLVPPYNQYAPSVLLAGMESPLDCDKLLSSNKSIHIVPTLNPVFPYLKLSVSLFEELTAPEVPLPPLASCPPSPQLFSGIRYAGSLHKNKDENCLWMEMSSTSIDPRDLMHRLFLEVFTAGELVPLRVPPPSGSLCCCAVGEDKKWHRAVVVGGSASADFLVRLVDTGERITLPKSQVFGVPSAVAAHNSLLTMETSAFQCTVAPPPSAKEMAKRPPVDKVQLLHQNNIEKWARESPGVPLTVWFEPTDETGLCHLFLKC